jgi:hypothetical protein
MPFAMVMRAEGIGHGTHPANDRGLEGEEDVEIMDMDHIELLFTKRILQEEKGTEVEASQQPPLLWKAYDIHLSY